jgi:hypothetical protein
MDKINAYSVVVGKPVWKVMNWMFQKNIGDNIKISLREIATRL